MYQRLQKLNVTVSHKTVIRLVTALGENHDVRVVEWRDRLKGLLADDMVIIIRVTNSLA